MDKWYEIVWPTLVTSEGANLRNEQKKQRDLAAIERARWNDVESVLDEARRLADLEMNRRKSAESKATIYLAALAALLPLTGTLVNTRSEHLNAEWQWQIIVFLGFLCVIAVYFVASGIWSLRTIKRSVHHRLDVDELVAAQENPSADAMLCKAILKSVVNDRYGTNAKVSSMAMAHAFFVRLFVMYVLLLVFVGLTTLWPSKQEAAISAAPYAIEGRTSGADGCLQPEADNTQETPPLDTHKVTEEVHGANRHRIEE